MIPPSWGTLGANAGGSARVVALLAWCALAGPPAEAQPADPVAPVREITLTAERFHFTPSTIEVRQGERIRLVIRSRDVLHGFRLELFGIDVEIPRSGEPVVVEVVAERPGRFPFACSLYCGRGHDGMTGVLTVLPPATGEAQPAGPDRLTESYPGEFEDLSLDLAEPDFTIITLPTTRRVPRSRSAFRVTHRFTRPLGTGSVGDLVADLFGLDGGARVGLEFRVGIAPGTQVGIYRTGDRTIQLFGQHTLLGQQPDGSPLGVGFVGSVEGLNNFRHEYSPALGVLLSRKVGDRAAFYLQPWVVGNPDVTDRFGFRLADGPERDAAFLLGAGLRIRIRPTAYVVAEFVPRVAGFDPGRHHATFGIEKRVGGHLFQLNFSNSIGSTPGQLARGSRTDDWHLGFNITRRFF